MPEKDGDGAKSTKSVVNKKQKQMMGEEGYDIARDMGRVRPSKDKKDATTLPKSKRENIKGDTPMQKEFKKKYGKKATALDAVKQEYKGQIMNVGKKGKKKVQDEFDLTQVAEAFGGYIVEAPIEDDKITAKPGEAGRTRKKISKIEKEITAPKPGEEEGAKKLISKVSNNNQNRRGRKSLIGNIPPEERGGEVDKDPDTEVKRRELSAQQDDKVRGEVSRQVKADAATDNLISKIRQGKTKAGEDASKVSSRRADRVRGASGGKKTGSLRQGNLEFPGDRTGATQQAKADIEARKGFAGARTVDKKGNVKKISGLKDDERNQYVDRPFRDDRATEPDPFDTPTADPKKMFPFGKKPVTGGLPMGEPTLPSKNQKTLQQFDRDRSDLKQAIRNLRTSKERMGQVSPAQQRKKARADAQSAFNRQQRLSQTDYMGGDFGMGQPEGQSSQLSRQKVTDFKTGKETEKMAPERGGPVVVSRQRKSKSGEEIVRTLPKKNLKIVQATPMQNALATAKIATQRYSQFAKNNPALGLASYDLGKGIIGKVMNKIMKAKMPAVVGGRAGFRSAGGNTAT